MRAASFGTAKPGGSFFPPSLQYYSAATPVLAYSLAQGQGRARQVEVPEGLLHEAADRRRRPEVRRPSPRSSSSRWRRSTSTSRSRASTTPRSSRPSRSSTTTCSSTTRSTTSATPTRWRRSNSTSRTVARRRTGRVTTTRRSPSSCTRPRPSSTPTKRAALYAKIQALVAEDAPFVPLDYPPYIYATSKQGPGLRGQPGRRLPTGGRLANLSDGAIHHVAARLGGARRLRCQRRRRSCSCTSSRASAARTSSASTPRRKPLPRCNTSGVLTARCRASSGAT